MEQILYAAFYHMLEKIGVQILYCQRIKEKQLVVPYMAILYIFRKQFKFFTVSYD